MLRSSLFIFIICKDSTRMDNLTSYIAASPIDFSSLIWPAARNPNIPITSSSTNKDLNSFPTRLT